MEKYSISLGRFNNSWYFCRNMRKELGKWLMDIAKYMTTALVLSSVFGDMDSPLMLIVVVAGAAITLIVGLFLVKEKKED